MIPACAALLPCTLTTRATIVPSPVSGWYTKWKPSEAVTIVPEPAPDTVNVPLAKPALPATPTEPISPSDQTEGSVGIKRIVSEIVVVFVKLPEIPVTVGRPLPVAASCVHAKGKLLFLAVRLGLNVAVPPLGRPDADKLALPLKPPWGLTVIVLVPFVPWTTLRLFGEADRP